MAVSSLSIEFSPLLAGPVVAEVALLDEPQPKDGVVEVPLGEPVNLTYDVRADFTSNSQVGFDAIRVLTPEAVEFQRFEMGEPLAAVEPDNVVVEEGAVDLAVVPASGLVEGIVIEAPARHRDGPVVRRRPLVVARLRTALFPGRVIEIPGGPAIVERIISRD